MKLLHIGLGKCGSSYLKHVIFPELEKKIKIKQLFIDDIVDRENTVFHDLENQSKIDRKLPKNFILSWENLFSYNWEFSRIEKSFKYIKNNFSSDTTILIVLRNPYDLLNSIYCHQIQKLRIKDPQNFFYIKENQDVRKDGKFNLYNFDYNLFISIYRSYFKKVVIVKYEELNNLNFIKEIFILNDDFINKLKKKKLIKNKTISKNAIKIIFFLNRYFNLNKYDRFMRSHIRKKNKNLIHKIKNKIIMIFIFKNFFQNFFDKIYPYKKYQIKKEYIPIDIENEINKYKQSKF